MTGAFILVSACSQQSHSGQGSQSATPVPQVAATPAKIGFACDGKEDDGDAASAEKITRHFVLDAMRLYELSDQSGKLEDVCNGHPCRMQVTDAAINVMQGYSEVLANGTTSKTGRILTFNRITGQVYESWSTSFASSADGHTSEMNSSFDGVCAKEAPHLEMKPKF